MRILKRKAMVKATVIMLAVAVVAFATVYLISPSYFFTLGDKKGGAAAAEQFTSDRLNIVLLGFDGNEQRSKKSSVFRPDTIMIASLNFKTKEVSLASIPRDSYVKIAGTETYDKINHSYVYGYNAAEGEDKHQQGLDTTVRTIEDFLGGIPIHYYVAVDMDGVAEVVDRVGGVYFDVPYPVRTNYGQGRLLVDEGYQLLDGRSFLCYVRDRSAGGDFGRAARQQEILIEAFDQIKERGKLCDLPALYRSVQDNVETNLNVAQVAQLAIFGLQVKTDQITSHVFSGSCQSALRDGYYISYVVIDEQERVELIKEVFGVEVPLRPQISLSGPGQKSTPVSPTPSPAQQTPAKPQPSAPQVPEPVYPVEEDPQVVEEVPQEEPAPVQEEPGAIPEEPAGEE
ncbi:MAG: LCP family protein [Dethiobacteria bacterium]